MFAKGRPQDEGLGFLFVISAGIDSLGKSHTRM